jgi:putative endonuclease
LSISRAALNVPSRVRPNAWIAVYILASRRNGTLYTGVTSELTNRVLAHKQGAREGFAKRYGCKILAWFESHDTMASAIQRETSIKRWNRAWKLALIERDNPEWRDLSDGWFDAPAGAITLEPWAPGSR